jgi:hypothetical protein
MFDWQSWIERFKQQPGYNDAKQYGVTVSTTPVSRWRVIGVHHLTGAENVGKHNVFVDILDEKGERINGARLRWGWEGMRAEESPNDVVIDKPAWEPGGNIALDKGQIVFCHVVDKETGGDTSASDWAAGFHTGHADEGTGNTWGHHSFFVVFQKDADIPEPVEPPEPGPGDPVTSPSITGRVQVTVNQAWVASLEPDVAGDVTFQVGINGEKAIH